MANLIADISAHAVRSIGSKISSEPNLADMVKEFEQLQKAQLALFHERQKARLDRSLSCDEEAAFNSQHDAIEVGMSAMAHHIAEAYAHSLADLNAKARCIIEYLEPGECYVLEHLIRGLVRDLRRLHDADFDRGL